APASAIASTNACASPRLPSCVSATSPMTRQRPAARIGSGLKAQGSRHAQGALSRTNWIQRPEIKGSEMTRPGPVACTQHDAEMGVQPLRIHVDGRCVHAEHWREPRHAAARPDKCLRAGNDLSLYGEVVVRSHP